jgi:hypothetical protein
MAMKNSHPKNLERAGWAELAFKAFTVATFGGNTPALLIAASGTDGDAQDALGDLLGDLQHMADVMGLDFARAVESGAMHYAHESAPTYEGD